MLFYIMLDCLHMARLLIYKWNDIYYNVHVIEHKADDAKSHTPASDLKSDCKYTCNGLYVPRKSFFLFL